MPVASLEFFPFRRDAGSHGVELCLPASDNGQEKRMGKHAPQRADEPTFHNRHSRSTQEH